MNKIKSVISQNKIFFLLVLFGISFVDLSYAAEVSDPVASLQKLGSFFVYALVAVFLLIVDFAGGLLGTSYITGPAASEPLREIWVIVRDLTNLGFVFLIMFLAFSNFFSGNSGTWTIKEKLPRLMIAVIAVNFSFLAVRVAVDVVDVGTHAILGVSDSFIEERMASGVEGKISPAEILNNYRPPGCDELDAETEAYCQTVKESFENIFCGEGRGLAAETDECLFRFTEIANRQDLDSDDTNIFMAFAVQLGGLKNLPLAAGVRATDAAVVTLFALILTVAMIGAFLMVMAAMIGRLIFMWLAMAFSPVFVAGWILGIGGGDSFKTQFITHLIMPLKVAAAFAVGFILFSSMIELSFLSNGSVTLGPAFKNLAFFPNGTEEGTVSSGALLWRVATIIVFWKAAEWATKDTVADSVVQGIGNFTKSAGKLAGNYAVDQVRLPGADISLASIKDLPNYLNRGIVNKRGDDLRTFLDPKQKEYMNTLNDTLGKINKGSLKRDDGDKIATLLRDSFRIKNMDDSKLRTVYDKFDKGTLPDSYNTFGKFKEEYQKAEELGGDAQTRLIGMMNGNRDYVPNSSASSPTSVNINNNINIDSSGKGSLSMPNPSDAQNPLSSGFTVADEADKKRTLTFDNFRKAQVENFTEGEQKPLIEAVKRAYGENASVNFVNVSDDNGKASIVIKVP